MVRSIRVSGPAKLPDDAFPPSQQEILRRVAQHRDEKWNEVEQAATECLLPLMRRAFREPVSKEEVKPYAQLVVMATDRGDSYYRGLQIAISAVLVSPRFLFRVETPPEDCKYEEDGSVNIDAAPAGDTALVFPVEQSAGRTAVKGRGSNQICGEGHRATCAAPAG